MSYSNTESYDSDQLRRIIEGAILAAGEALSVDKLHSLFEEYEAPEKSEIKAVLESIAADCQGRGFHLVEVASGWRFQVREDVATWVNRLWEEKPQKYSRAMLETLALIAYRQPLTRGDIEDVRGVAVSSHIIRTLVEREWVKVVGHRDVPGRPSLYATTRHFLDYFNLKSLDELPSLSELKDIDSINGSLDLGDDNASESDADVLEDTLDTAVSAAAEASSSQENAGENHSVSQDSSIESGPADEQVSQYDDDPEQLDETLADDTLTDDSLTETDDEIQVREVEIPVLFDQDATLPTDTAVVADAEPTLEQEEFAATRRARADDEQGSDEHHDEQERASAASIENDDEERDYSEGSLFTSDHSSGEPSDHTTDTGEPPANSTDKQ